LEQFVVDLIVGFIVDFIAGVAIVLSPW
jgi:hypothetical protein